MSLLYFHLSSTVAAYGVAAYSAFTIFFVLPYLWGTQRISSTLNGILKEDEELIVSKCRCISSATFLSTQCNTLVSDRLQECLTYSQVLRWYDIIQLSR